MYVEMIDETGQVSEEIKNKPWNYLILQRKTWQERQGNGGYFCN